MKIRLTEDKLHQLVRECVRRVLNESETGIQSQKLYDILQKYGGIKRSYEGSRNPDNRGLDVHNLKDDDVVTVMPVETLRQITSDKRYEVDHGRWAENFGLDAWAKSQGIEKIPGDRMDYLMLGDGKHAVIVINRNECLVPERGEEGWAGYHHKKEKRRNDKNWDGKYDYIHKYKRPWAWDRQFKNPWKKEPQWTRDAIEKDMQSIRDHYALGDKRETQY